MRLTIIPGAAEFVNMDAAARNAGSTTSAQPTADGPSGWPARRLQVRRAGLCGMGQVCRVASWHPGGGGGLQRPRETGILQSVYYVYPTYSLHLPHLTGGFEDFPCTPSARQVSASLPSIDVALLCGQRCDVGGAANHKGSPVSGKMTGSGWQRPLHLLASYSTVVVAVGAAEGIW